MITNLTPHSITIIRDNGTQITYQSGQPVARVSQDTAPVGLLDDGVPAVTTQFGDIVNLPDPVPGFYYLVSGLVAQRAWALGRTDVICPGALVRDDSGNVIGCQNFIVHPNWNGAV